MSVYMTECCSSKTKKTTDIQNSMDETQKHFVLWKKNQIHTIPFIQNSRKHILDGQKAN